jgi:hypothetical protein
MSLGGYIGPETCRKDARLRACLAVDAGQTAPVAQDGLTQPLMIMTRDADVMRQERASAGGWPEDEIRHTIDTQRALYAHNRADAFYLTMNRMYHVNWTDAPVWSPLVRMLGLTGPVDPHVGFAETNAYSIAFFDRYLKGRPSPLLNPAVLESSDVTVEARFFDPHATQLSR